MIIKRYGWKRDQPDIRDIKYAAPPAVLNTLPDHVDLRDKMPPVFDQGNLGCHDSITEVLTDVGWKLFADLSNDDKLASVCPETQKLIFEKPTRLIKFHHKGDMYYGKHNRLDYAVTPDHKMLARKWNESKRTLDDKYQFTEMKDVGWYVGFMNDVVNEGKVKTDTYTLEAVTHKTKKEQTEERTINMKDWLLLLGIYLAEGTLLKQNDKAVYGIQIAASKEREKKFVRELLKRLDLNALEREDRFVFHNKQIYIALAKLGLQGVRAPFKFVPAFVFDLPAEQIKHLLLGHFMGDGCEQNGLRSYYTSSKRLADDLQRLIFLSGGWATIGERGPRTSRTKDGRDIKGKYSEYRVSEWASSGLSLDRREHVTKEYYDGEVFCADVTTYHTLVTRRNGKMLISGNSCTANATAGQCWFLDKTAPFEPARLFIYYNTRILEGTVREDSGASIRNSIKSVVRWGFCSETDWPYEINKFTRKPPSKAYRDAMMERITQYASVTQNEQQIKSVLAQGIPVNFGFSVYSSFESDAVTNTGIVPMPTRDEQILGGHATLISGYKNSTRQYIVRNSWGPNWGDKGYFYMPFAYIHNPDLADDFWMIKAVP